MSDPAKPSKPVADVPVSEETRMRHALGLRDDGAYRRPAQRREHDARGRRFVKDGEVPVVVLNGSREAPAPAPTPANRVAEAEEALRAERLAHERAEQSLREAQAGVERLETKLVHAEMAHGEALATERQAREAAETALSAAVAARQALEARAAELEARLVEVEARPAPGRKRASAADASGRAVAKPKGEPAGEVTEQEPVKWWLPSYRVKRAKRK